MKITVGDPNVDSGRDTLPVVEREGRLSDVQIMLERLYFLLSKMDLEDRLQYVKAMGIDELKLGIGIDAPYELRQMLVDMREDDVRKMFWDLGIIAGMRVAHCLGDEKAARSQRNVADYLHDVHLIARCSYERAVIDLYKNNMDEAWKCAHQAMEQGYDMGKCKVILGEVEKYYGHFGAAEEYFRMALEKNNPDAAIQMWMLMKIKKNPAGALAVLKNNYRITRSEKVLQIILRETAIKNDYDDLMEIFLELVEEGDFGVIDHVINMNWKDIDQDLLWQFAVKAARLVVTSKRPYELFGLNDILAKKAEASKDDQEAIFLLEELAEMGDIDAADAAGIIYMSRNQMDKCLNFLSIASDLGSQNADFNLGTVLRKCGSFKGAEAYWVKLIDSENGRIAEMAKAQLLKLYVDFGEVDKVDTLRRVCSHIKKDVWTEIAQDTVVNSVRIKLEAKDKTFVN